MNEISNEEAEYQACKFLIERDRNMCNKGDYFGLAKGKEEWDKKGADVNAFFI